MIWNLSTICFWMIFRSAAATHSMTKVVSHAGRVIAISRRQEASSPNSKIGYSILNPSPDDPAQSASWREWEAIKFPNELRPVGMDVITVDFKDAEIPTDGQAPFDVLSDGTWIYVFRQSLDRSIYVNRFAYDETTGRLEPAWDVRFRRSRKADIPLDRRDTLGSMDMNGDRFIEATIDLDFVDVVSGRFSVVLMPTELAGVARWQFFVVNSGTSRLESWSIARSSNGLFDLTDTIDPATGEVEPNQVYRLLGKGGTEVLPVGGAASLLFNEQEWLEDEYGKVTLQKRGTRVMVALPVSPDSRIATLDFSASKEGRLAQVGPDLPLEPSLRPGTCLAFSKEQGTRVDLPASVVGGEFTLEMWVAPDSFTSDVDVLAQTSAVVALPFALAFNAGVPTLAGPGGVVLAAEREVSVHGWTHIAAVWGRKPVLYVNGQPYSDSASLTPPTPPQASLVLGGDSGLTGLVDEVRLWKVARSQAEVLSTMCAPVSPATPGWANLVGYWTMDEPADNSRFSTVPNASAAGASLDGELAGAKWSATSAPVGASLPPVAWDEDGLTACAALLPFATTDQAPCLYEGADALIHLYYSEKATNALLVVYASLIVARATYSLPWSATDARDPANDEEGWVNFIARQAGTTMNSAVVTPLLVQIGKPKNGKATVTLRSTTGYTEVWPDVPLELETCVAVINGDAAQKSTDPAEVARSPIMYDYKRVTVTPAGGQRGHAPAAGAGSAIFRMLPEDVPSNGAAAVIEPTDGSSDLPVRRRAGTDRWWIVSPPLCDLDMNSGDQLVKVLSSNAMTTYDGALNLTRDMAIEAWLKVAASQMGNSATLLVFNKASGGRYLLGLDTECRPIAANADVVLRGDAAVPQDGAWHHLAASFRTDFGVQLGGARYLDCGADESLSSSDAVTIESWVRLDELAADQVIAAKWDEKRGRSWRLFVDGAGKPAFSVLQSTATGTLERTVTSDVPLTIGEWHHVAGVYDVAFEPQVAIMFQVGTFVKVPALSKEPVDGVTVAMWVKRLTPDVPGRQILAQSVDPSQPLVFFLSLKNGAPTFGVTVNGVETRVSVATPLRLDDWVHIAGSYNATDGVLLSIDGVAVARAKSTGETGRDPRPALGAPSGVTAAYTFGGLGGQDSYIGLINEVSIWNRGLSLDEIRQKIRRPLAASERGLCGYWRFNDLYGTTVMDLAGTANGELVGGNFVRVDKGAFAQKIFVDGQARVFDRVVDPVVISGTGVTLGMSGFESYWQGAIAQTRLWKMGRMNWQIDWFGRRELESNAEGLIALWAFGAGKGRIVFDSKGDNNATIRDGRSDLTDQVVAAMWIRTNFRAAWSLYLDGVAMVTAPSSLGLSGFGDEQATIAAVRVGGAVGNPFAGELNELRVWSSQRTGLQVRESMYTRLSGSEAKLAALWPMADGSSDVISDLSGGGANGRWVGSSAVPPWQTSLAPIGQDPPDVRPALGGVGLPQNRLGPYAPGVGRYGVLDIDARGDMGATLQQAYAFTALPSNDLTFVSGFKVGDLDLQFVGQAQMAPTLIGYIEGAPPLPAENLKVYPDSPGSYVGASTLSLDEQRTKIYSYSASRDVGTDLTLSTRIGLAIESETDAGFGVETTVFSVSAALGLAAEVDEALSETDDALVSEETMVTAKKSVESSGRWYENKSKIDDGAGSLFYPLNTGYALVRSGTADLFAMRVKGTGSLIGYTTRPNPDTPEDINVIMFRLKPTYVKNGTLDGYIGFQPDETYKFLPPGERGSYFKPLQAYAMKQAIDREHQQRAAAFARFDARGLGRRDKAGRPGEIDLAEQGRSLANILMGVKDKDALTVDEWRARMARRNMVNTYVWTAEGGFYSEEEQFTAVREESTGGSYSMTAKAGIYTELSFNVGPAFELSAMFGSHIFTQALKTEHDADMFALDVSVPGERYIGLIEKDASDELIYTDKPSPGKVKSYRFMTFYLAPTKSNFDTFKDDVVDGEWLYGQGAYAGQYDPDALALRQALTQPNEVWRVLHRVTYVSRVPPVTQSEGESLTPGARRPDELSEVANTALIVALPADPSKPNAMAQVSAEADALLDELVTRPVWGPVLAAARVETKADIITYMRSFYALN